MGYKLEAFDFKGINDSYSFPLQHWNIFPVFINCIRTTSHKKKEKNTRNTNCFKENRIRFLAQYGEMGLFHNRETGTTRLNFIN